MFSSVWTIVRLHNDPATPMGVSFHFGERSTGRSGYSTQFQHTPYGNAATELSRSANVPTKPPGRSKVSCIEIHRAPKRRRKDKREGWWLELNRRKLITR